MSWKWFHALLTFGVATPSFITAFTVAASLHRAEQGHVLQRPRLLPGQPGATEMRRSRLLWLALGLMVAPIFTGCRAVCSLVAKALHSAWGENGPEGASAQIVLVSFDPQDTRADMAHFRELFDLPRSWHLATVEREEGLRFFSSLGFRWRTLSRRQFDHSGKIFVLTGTGGLRIASVLGPDQLTSERLAAEVTAAATGASLARRLGTHWLGFFGVGAILLTLVVAVTRDRMRSRRKEAERAFRSKPITQST